MKEKESERCEDPLCFERVLYLIFCSVRSDVDEKPKPPPDVGFSQTKPKQKKDFKSKSRVIRQLLADDPDDMSIDAQLARAQKIRAVA